MKSLKCCEERELYVCQCDIQALLCLVDLISCKEFVKQNV
jgi:hypothetical protein